MTQLADLIGELCDKIVEHNRGGSFSYNIATAYAYILIVNMSNEICMYVCVCVFWSLAIWYDTLITSKSIRYQVPQNTLLITKLAAIIHQQMLNIYDWIRIPPLRVYSLLCNYS